MKKIVLCSALVLLLLSCRSNTSTKKEGAALPASEEIAEKDKLHPALAESVLNIVQSKEHLKYPEIPLDSSFIAITFTVDPRGNAVYFSDSTVSVTYNVFTHYSNKIYKGMLTLDSINVVIFDRGNFGKQYYNIDSLKHVSLDKFKPYPMKVICEHIYYVKDGELKYWNP